jgi:uroporphyrinogen III methyltransferase/synthase
MFMKTGIVYIAGAGPGDLGLVTQKAIECLSAADVIIYDHLVNDKLLDYAAPQAEKIYAGKTSQAHEMEQEEINHLMVTKARSGKTVVRLKGGDPLVFGRGGEEMEALNENGIIFEVIPGLSSVTAVPSFAGIPLTHRGIASSFTVITGHENEQKISSSLCWEKLSTGADTLVFVMAMHNLPQIIANLIKHGRHPSTPVAVIENGTTPQQKTVISTLQDIENEVREHQLKPPSIIVVGQVVKLGNKLNWISKRPLFGKKVLVTRATHQANELSRQLIEKGARPVEFPTINIRPTANTGEIENTIKQLQKYQWVVFTSVNSVDIFFQHLNRLKLDARSFFNVNIGVIGPATCKRLESKGLNPDFIPDEYTSQGIISLFRKLDITGKRILLPRSNLADNELAAGLEALGAIVDQVTIYETMPVSNNSSSLIDILTKDKIDIVTFISSSAVTNFIKITGNTNTFHNITIACIGPKTAETAERVGLTVNISAATHTIPGLVSAIEEYFIKEI